MTEEMKPLPADLAALLRNAQEPPALSTRAMDRMEHRLGLAVVVAAGALSVVAPSLGGAFFAKIVLFFSRKLPLALLSLAVGAGIGATGHALLGRPGGARVVETVSAPVPSQVNPAPTAPAFLPPAVVNAEPSAKASAATVAPTGSQDVRPTTSVDPVHSDLAEERALLEMGRTALARGNHDAALDATRRHERAFPRGRLAEERELIAIQALSGLGRRDDARARAVRFLKVYPRSMFAPAVLAAAAPDP